MWYNTVMNYLILFIVGFIEMIIAAAWTKAVAETRVYVSGLVTVINIMIWYYVLSLIVDNINNWKIAVVYAIGCALGTMAGTYYFQQAGIKREKKKKSVFKSVINIFRM